MGGAPTPNGTIGFDPQPCPLKKPCNDVGHSLCRSRTFSRCLQGALHFGMVSLGCHAHGFSSPGLVPFFFFLFAFWGSLCFPLPGKNLIFGWGPNSSQVLTNKYNSDPRHSHHPRNLQVFSRCLCTPARSWRQVAEAQVWLLKADACGRRRCHG